MEKSEKNSMDSKEPDKHETEAVELILFQVSECYVYLIPPRKSAASYRADEWNVNKWAWEGSLKVISKEEECLIKLQDKTTGELYACAFLRDGEPHPVEPVIDSSRYFVLRIEEKIGDRLRHAFIGIGFRERTQAYDFQAALHDHMKYLNKKKTAEEMEQHYQTSSSVDYSLKEGETLVLQMKNKNTRSPKSTFCEQGLSNLSLNEGGSKEPAICLKPPPAPASSISPGIAVQSPPAHLSSNLCLEETANGTSSPHTASDSQSREQLPGKIHRLDDSVEDDYGDFQAAD